MLILGPPRHFASSQGIEIGPGPLTDFIVAREQENLAMQLGKLFTQDPARGE
jgi:hypothetical protein